MNTVVVDEVAELLERAGRLPAEYRLDLAQKILGTLAPELRSDSLSRTMRSLEPKNSFLVATEPNSEHKPKGTLRDLVGLLRTDGPPPTDEEIAGMLHDELMRRYGE